MLRTLWTTGDRSMLRTLRTVQVTITDVPCEPITCGTFTDVPGEIDVTDVMDHSSERTTTDSWLLWTCYGRHMLGAQGLAW